MAESSSGRWVAAASEAGWVTIWDRQDRERPEQVRFNNGPQDGPINDLRFSPDGRLLAIAGRNLAIYPTGEMEPLRLLRDDEWNYSALHFGRTGETLLAVTGKGTVEEISLENGEVLQSIWSTVKGEPAYGPDGSVLIHRAGAVHVGRWEAERLPNGDVVLRDSETGEVKELEGAVAESPVVAGAEPGTLLFGNDHGSVEVWDVEEGRLLEYFSEPEARH